MYDQHYLYLTEILSKLYCGFCKGYNEEHSLISMIEEFRKALCLHWSRVAANKTLLYFVYSQLENTKQRTKFISSYSNFEKILFDVQQEAILGTLVFNIHRFDPITSLKICTAKIFERLHNYCFKLNFDKKNLITPSKPQEEIQIEDFFNKHE